MSSSGASQHRSGDRRAYLETRRLDLAYEGTAMRPTGTTIQQAVTKPLDNSYVIRNSPIGARRRGRRGPDWYTYAIEILTILARAHAAAAHYEDLRRRSDADLASHGIRRADLPRVAFHMLTEACEVNAATAHRSERGVPRRVGKLCASSAWGVIANCLAALVAVCGVRASDLDPMSAVRLLIEAERATNLEAAVALFADDASITNVTGWKTADKEQLKWFINTEIWLRDRFQLHD